MKKFQKNFKEEKNNRKIDTFLNGIDCIKFGKKNNIHPKIKIPINAGYASSFKTNNPIFVFDSLCRCIQVFLNFDSINTKFL